MSKEILIVLGLVIDIIGVWLISYDLLVRFQIQNEERYTKFQKRLNEQLGVINPATKNNLHKFEKLKNNHKRFSRKLSWIGIFLITAGFICQIIGVLM